MASLSEEQSVSPEIGAFAASRMPRRWLFNRYLLNLAFFAILLGAAVTTVNSVVDPLWYWRGNQISGHNYIFNERVAKVNLLFQDPDAYDCLIFGSSRLTLLNQTQIEGYSCANLAFSAGKVEEFLAYAGYLARQGMRPKLIIVGVDGNNFLTKARQALEVPEFVQLDEPPPGLLKSYLSLSALDFAQRSLRRQSPMPRYYDESFIGRVLEDSPSFTPPGNLSSRSLRSAFDSGRVDLYRQLRNVFPDARFWGFVPPVSAWDIAESRYLSDILDPYLEAVFNTAKLFDVLYDFSAPSSVTRRRDNTYDGSHYFPEVYAVIVRRLQKAPTETPADHFGLPVHAMSHEHYQKAFKDALHLFLTDEFPALALAESPPR